MTTKTKTNDLAQQEMFALVEKLATVKSRQDVDAAMQIYHEEGTLASPSFGATSTGAEQIRSGLEVFFAVCPDYSVELDGYAFDDDTMVSWGKVSTTLTGIFDGHTPNGEIATVPVFILFNFKDNKIWYESFNLDLAGLCRQCGVPAEALVSISTLEGVAA
jgi:predicted ester cyclase